MPTYKLGPDTLINKSISGPNSFHRPHKSRSQRCGSCHLALFISFCICLNTALGLLEKSEISYLVKTAWPFDTEIFPSSKLNMKSPNTNPRLLSSSLIEVSLIARYLLHQMDFSELGHIFSSRQISLPSEYQICYTFVSGNLRTISSLSSQL